MPRVHLLGSAACVFVPGTALIASLLGGCGTARPVAQATQAPSSAPAEANASEPVGSIPQPVTLTATTEVSPAYGVMAYPTEQPAASNASSPVSPTLTMFGETAVIPASGPSDDPTENLRQVSFAAEGADFDPVLSSDGSKVYFSSTAHRANPDIYVKSVNGRAITQLTNDPAADVMPAVSPDGSRVAFASNRGGTWDLYVINASGGHAVQITSDNTHELHPTWSPDGRFLSFCKLGEVSNRWEVWVTEAEQLGVQKFLTYGLFPDWHPTGNQIVFQRGRDRGDRLFSVWTLNYKNGEASALTELASSPSAAYINPKWSPDGRFIAFAAVENPGQTPADQQPASADIWIMNASGGGLANLTGGRNANLMPAWGPGNALYFVSDRGGRQHIWAANTEQALLASRSIESPTMTADAQHDHFVKPASSMNGANPRMQAAGGAISPDARSKPLASKSAASAPTAAQSEADAPPEIANVPIDDPNH